MTRYCANCGTEVDETAAFCPTCGQPIDEQAEAEIPPAPAWPEPPPRDEAPQEARRFDEERSSRRAEQAPEPEPEARGWDDAPTRIEDRPRAEDSGEPETRARGEPPPPPARPDDSARPGPSLPPRRRPPDADRGRPSGPGGGMNLPITTPVTLSAWLIGIGALLAALGILIGLFDGFINPIDLLVLLALLAVGASVFLAANLPAIPNVRLITLVVSLIGFGIALDRIGFGGAGIGELLLFLGTAAAAIGAILVELGYDQPLGGPQS